jgi:DNA polymerase-3 subunit alpha
MDFLGLKNLTVIADTIALIQAREPGFDIKTIPLDDQKAFDLYNRGETIGLFQMESGGMTGVSKQFDVKSIEDIMALIALYRPGPMDLIPDYIKRKKGLTKIRHEHPLLQEITAETYGVMIYQEQVMAAAAKLAGYSLGQSDLLRRAMGKKDRAKMAKERANFIEGCARTNNIGDKKANAIFDLLEKFAGYGFNKSHSAAYGLISYQTAYLKANYPVEFMSGLLSNEINNTDKISIFVAECKRMGITILPPDVNRSGLKFRPEKWEKPERADDRATEAARTFGAIRYGLAAIKHVGEGAMETAIREREARGEFVSLEDFCGRLDSKVANRKMLESLIKSGAFDFLGRERAELFDCIDDSLAASAASQRDRAAGQVSLFDEETAPLQHRRIRSVAPWTEREKMNYEKELLGFYVTGHPLDAYAQTIAAGEFHKIASLGELADRATFRIAGAIAQVDRKFTKKEGKPFAVVWVEDLTGTLEVVLWNETYVNVAEMLEAGRVIAVRGTLDKRDDALRATAQRVKILAPDAASGASNGNGHVDQIAAADCLVLRFNSETTANELREVQSIISASPGPQRVALVFARADGGALRIDAGPDYSVNLTPEIETKLRPWLERKVNLAGNVPAAT